MAGTLRLAVWSRWSRSPLSAAFFRPNATATTTATAAPPSAIYSRHVGGLHSERRQERAGHEGPVQSETTATCLDSSEYNAHVRTNV